MRVAVLTNRWRYYNSSRGHNQALFYAFVFVDGFDRQRNR